MKFTPIASIAIEIVYGGLLIYCAQTPSKEVSDEIFDLERNPGIKISDKTDSRALSESVRPQRQRLYYQVQIPPVFNEQAIANLFACHLRDQHGLTVAVLTTYEHGSRLKLIKSHGPQY